MGADGTFVGGGVDPQNGSAAAAPIGVAAAAFCPGGGGGVDATERVPVNLCLLQFLNFGFIGPLIMLDTAPPVTPPTDLLCIWS